MDEMKDTKQQQEQIEVQPEQHADRQPEPAALVPPKELHGISKLSIVGLPTLDLFYDFNVLADVEELTGCNMLAAVGHLNGNMGSKEMRALLYGLARINHPRLTLEQIGQYLRIDTFQDVFDACWEACVRGSGDEFARSNLEMLDKLNELKAANEAATKRGQSALLESTAEGLRNVNADKPEVDKPKKKVNGALHPEK